MSQRWIPVLLAAAVGLGCFSVLTQPAHAQGVPLTRYYYYPYYFFPADYWPSMGPQYPEPPGAPYVPPPAYMAYPPFLEKHWRYEAWQPQSWYRGSHFWLDQF
jgi:hypothetical protein